MRISIFCIPDITPGKHNLKDGRLDQVQAITKSRKKTYIQLELAGEESALDADAILAAKDSRADLILKDLEFIETRLSRSEEEAEKKLLHKLKSILEKEEFIFSAGLNEEERGLISGYGLFTSRPVVLAEYSGPADLDNLLAEVIKESGYISFFTAGEKEASAWLIKKGATAWEAAGVIHSDMQKGFIRAEIIAFGDFIQAKGETQAKQAGKLRLEQKDYLMQDADLTNFRFNK